MHMFKQDAKEVEEFAFRGCLLQPQAQTQTKREFELVIDNLDEAFRLYFLPLDEPEEADRLKLTYLPDVVALQHKLGVMGSEPYATIGMLMHERVRIAVAYRMGHSHPKLAREVEGALCQIIDGRLVQGKANELFEEMFKAYQCGYWPCGIVSRGKTLRLAVYSGGIVLDHDTLDLPS